MLHSDTSDQAKRIDPQRYLPRRLYRLWQAGELAAGEQHLRAVLRAVLTYLPQRVAQEQLVDPKGPAVSGRFIEATLMFADISGFTAMSEQLTQLGREGAEVITAIVNDYFEAMLEIIARHGGDLFKFGGDALLVCFSGEEAAARACGAALEMQSEMARFAVIETEQGTFNLRMKVGLGTGSLLLASLGSAERLEFAVMGAALGRMASAESQAEAGEVLSDEATCEAARDAIEAEEAVPGYYRLKGMHSEQGFPCGSGEAEDSLTQVGSDARRLVSCLDGLTSYIPPRVLERIIASPGRRMIEGEHRLVTVLFANFYGIDEMIAALGEGQAEEITAILNRHFKSMQRVIQKYEGIVNKVDTYAVGYRIMALFGAPIAHEDDPARAVRAALEMQEEIGQFNGGEGVETSAGRFELKQRVGVNTGHEFAGHLGSTLRQEYSVMGDEVNLAARLMGVAAEGQVLISHATARHIQGQFELQERQAVQVKGKREPVRNYRVLRSAEGQGDRSVGRGAFFGRREEMDMAQRLLDATLAGRGAVLDVSGDRGIGKSRLVDELGAYARDKGVAILRGEALSYGGGIPYLPWNGVWHALFGFREEQDLERRRDKLVAALHEAALSDWAPIVGTVLGVEIPETPLTLSLDAQMRQQRFFDVVLQLILNQAARTPLVLVLDDLQWADGVSLDLAAYVARNVLDSRILLVIIHRPDFETVPWRASEGCQRLHLSEMEDQDSLDLARSVLGGNPLSSPLQRLILDRAQGNPLFVEEVARTLRESGAIQLQREPEDGQVWDIVGAVADIEVPTTLTGLIMNRIDQLETPNRHLLQVASVIGVAFRSAMLSRVYPYDDVNGTLGSRLARLVELDLAAFSPPDEYTFKHTLTQEVAYESLLYARRRELHVRVGEDIEQHHASDLVEYFGVLVRHFDEGRVLDKAFDYMVKAGDRGRIEFANEVALDYYRRALETAAGIGTGVEAEVLDALDAMGDIYLLTSRYAEAVEHFQRAIAHPICTACRCGDLLQKVAQAFEQQGQYDEALQHLEQGRWVLSGSEGDRQSAEMARIFHRSGWVHVRRGEMEQAIKDCEQGLAILAEQEHSDAVLRDEADLYDTLGSVYVEQGSYSQAQKAHERSTELRQQCGDLPGLARSYNNLAKVAWSQGNLTKSGDYLERMLEISQQIGNNHFMAFGYNNLGAVSFVAGEAERALEYYHTALPLQQRIGDTYGMAQSYNNIGEAHNALGQYTEARRYLEQAAMAFEGIQSEVGLYNVFQLLAEIELALGDAVSALDYGARALRIAANVGNPVWQGKAERTIARGKAHMGDVPGAVQSFEASIGFLGEVEDQIELARSHYEFGALLAEQPGREGQARDQLEQAADLFAGVGAQKEAAQARGTMEKLGK